MSTTACPPGALPPSQRPSRTERGSPALCARGCGGLPLSASRAAGAPTRGGGRPAPRHPRGGGGHSAVLTSTPAAAEIWAGTFEPTLEIDHSLADGEVLELGHRRLRVVWTPGHTAGHCCFLDLTDGSFFVGDHLLPKITPHVGVFATGPRNPLGDFLASQAQVAEPDVGIVCPAHGRVFTTHRHRAHQIIAHHEHRLREIRDIIHGRPRSAYEVAQKVFAWAFQDPEARMQRGAAVMETLAHLELLHARGDAARQDREGVVRFCAAG